jgi:hypothetical protein
MVGEEEPEVWLESDVRLGDLRSKTTSKLKMETEHEAKGAYLRWPRELMWTTLRAISEAA